MFSSDHQTLKESYLVRKTQLSTMRDERERLFSENDGLKNRIKNADYVRDVIEELSLLGQGRALKQYEAMLNAASSDVMEENSKKIRLELTSSSRGYGVPELNIYVERPSGNELIEYNGGSFNNVISLTSRVFAIMRSKHLRNFMALDEADCHIRGPRKGDYEGDSPSTSKRFYNALYKLSRETSMQSMAITHHDVSLFKDIGINDSDTEGQPNINIMRVIRNEQSGNYIVETTGAPVWDNDSVTGIRSITLENIANYHKTTFRLGQGVNIITGSHDIGKSQVINALRLMFYRSGQGGSRLAAHIVRHGQKTGVIRVMIENGIELVLTIKKSVSRSKIGKSSVKGDLTWEVFDHKNKNSKGEPELYKIDGDVCRGGIGNNVPEWVSRVSGIELSQVEDGKWDNAIAVQIAEQSQPGFLTANTRPRDRAHILSIGESVNIPRRMKEQNERELLDAQRTIRANDKRIKELGGLISRINPIIDNLGRILESLYKVEENISTIKKKKEKIDIYPRKIKISCATIIKDSITLDALEKNPSQINSDHNLTSDKNSLKRVKENNNTYSKTILIDKNLNNIPERINEGKNTHLFNKVKEVKRQYYTYTHYVMVIDATKSIDANKLYFSSKNNLVRHYKKFNRDVVSYTKNNVVESCLTRVPDIISIRKSSHNIRNAKNGIMRIKNNNVAYIKNINIDNVLRTIPSVLDANKNTYLFDKAKDIKRESSKYNYCVSVFNIVNDVSEAEINSFAKDNIVKAYGKINKGHKSYLDNDRVSSLLSKMPSTIVSGKVVQDIKSRRERFSKQYGEYKNIISVILCMDNIPDEIKPYHYHEASKIEGVVSETRKNIDNLVDSSYKIKTIEDEHVQANKDYEDLIDKLKICPLCHSDLKKGHSHV